MSAVTKHSSKSYKFLALTSLLIFVPNAYAATSCTREVSTLLRTVNSAAKQCGKAKNYIYPLNTKRLNIVAGSADDLFTLSLQKIGLSGDALEQIQGYEQEIVQERDAQLADVDESLVEANQSVAEPCAAFQDATAKYNAAVSRCSRARKKTVTLSCSASLRYANADAKNASKRCSRITTLATNLPKQKTAVINDINKEIERLEELLEDQPSNANEIQAALTELKAARDSEGAHYNTAIQLTNAYKTPVCQSSTSLNKVYADLKKACGKR